MLDAFETEIRQQGLPAYGRASTRAPSSHRDVSATAANFVDLAIDSLLSGGRFNRTVWRVGSAGLMVWRQRHEMVVVPSMWFSYAAGVSRKGEGSYRQCEKHHCDDQFLHVGPPIQRWAAAATRFACCARQVRESTSVRADSRSRPWLMPSRHSYRRQANSSGELFRRAL
jgi:hypothetical protein